MERVRVVTKLSYHLGIGIADKQLSAMGGVEKTPVRVRVNQSGLATAHELELRPEHPSAP